jgi:chromosome segregation ATPase
VLDMPGRFLLYAIVIAGLLAWIACNVMAIQGNRVKFQSQAIDRLNNLASSTVNRFKERAEIVALKGDLSSSRAASKKLNKKVIKLEEEVKKQKKELQDMDQMMSAMKKEHAFEKRQYIAETEEKLKKLDQLAKRERQLSKRVQTLVQEKNRIEKEKMDLQKELDDWKSDAFVGESFGPLLHMQAQARVVKEN